MRRTGIFLLVLVFLFSLGFPFLQAQDNSTSNSNQKNDTPSNDREKIDLAFECLEDKADDCEGLSTQEVALTILASPRENFDECVDELLSREKNDNFGNVRDTALAILALDHAGEDTEDYTDWLVEQEQNPSELIWYLQQDSNERVECSMSYNTRSHTVVYGENKKVSTDAGECLTRSSSNFWLKVAPGCYDTDFLVQCDKEFITSFLYQNKDSSTVHVLEQTENSPAYGTINMSLKSKCFGDSSTCSYEATAWATVALLRTKYDIEAYIPYLIALSDTNERYLPEAFIYLATDFEDYANQLLEDQKLGNYWEAKKTAYNRFYDTGLALISLGRTSNSEKVENARKQLLFSQGSNGCWANNVRDTAMVLWALEGRAGGGGGTGSGPGANGCSASGFYCTPQTQCPSGEVLNNYYCSGLSTVCCRNENLPVCADLQGKACPSGTVCTGNAKKTSDVASCCLGTCEQANQLTECEEQGYACRSACSTRQEQVSLTCNQGSVCCKTKQVSETKGLPWTTIIIILIVLIALVILGIIFRKRLGLWWFALRARFKRDKRGGGRTPGTGVPPRGRPGRPPTGMQRRPPLRRRPSTPPRPPTRTGKPQDKEFDDTFSKLRGYTK